jgi:hypothetical protein
MGTSGRQTSSTRRRRMPNRPGAAAVAGEGGRSLSITSTRAAGSPGTARPRSRARRHDPGTATGRTRQDGSVGPSRSGVGVIAARRPAGLERWSRMANYHYVSTARPIFTWNSRGVLLEAGEGLARSLGVPLVAAEFTAPPGRGRSGSAGRPWPYWGCGWWAAGSGRSGMADPVLGGLARPERRRIGEASPPRRST